MEYLSLLELNVTRLVAPEIIDFSETSTKADIWSLACTVIELYTGSPPYFEKQPMSAMFCIVKYDFPPLPVGMSPVIINC